MSWHFLMHYDATAALDLLLHRYSKSDIFYFWICRMKKEVLIAPGVWELSLLFLSFRPFSNFYLTSIMASEKPWSL